MASDRPHVIGLGVPGVTFKWGAMLGYVFASEKYSKRFIGGFGSYANFNLTWALALNEFEAGTITHFAMLCSDVAPDRNWIDSLVAEMDRTGHSLISVATPIKDDRGLLSCGIGTPENPFDGAFRRFTVRELLRMPKLTMTAEDLGYPGGMLLHNNSCWIADLRDPRFRQEDGDGNLAAWFDFRSRIRRNTEGHWSVEVESEDWFFSRKLWELGMHNTAITLAVHLKHAGSQDYPNFVPWGQECDEETRAKWLSARVAPAPALTLATA